MSEISPHISPHELWNFSHSAPSGSPFLNKEAVIVREGGSRFWFLHECSDLAEASVRASLAALDIGAR